MATQWEVVIGLETHAQLSTVSKIFSGASTQFGAEPNTQACPVDLALPGVLPVLNRGAVERAIDRCRFPSRLFSFDSRCCVPRKTAFDNTEASLFLQRHRMRTRRIGKRRTTKRHDERHETSRRAR